MFKFNFIKSIIYFVFIPASKVYKAFEGVILIFLLVLLSEVALVEASLGCTVEWVVVVLGWGATEWIIVCSLRSTSKTVEVH